MFGFGRKNSLIDQCADTLLERLVHHVPPSDERSLERGKSQPARNLGKTASQIERDVRGFTADHKLGVYGKARLLNRLKWRMKEAGYSDAFIDATVGEVTLMLTRAQRAQASAS